MIIIVVAIFIVNGMIIALILSLFSILVSHQENGPNCFLPPLPSPHLNHQQPALPGA